MCDVNVQCHTTMCLHIAYKWHERMRVATLYDSSAHTYTYADWRHAIRCNTSRRGDVYMYIRHI